MSEESEASKEVHGPCLFRPMVEELRAALSAKEAELGRAREAFNMIEENCPRWLDPATVSPGKRVEDMPPHQAVLQFAIAYTKWEALKAALLSPAAEPTGPCEKCPPSGSDQTCSACRREKP